MERFGEGQVTEGHDRYTVFSLWDTYRNVHQLLTLVYPERQTDMVRSMIDMSKEWGWLPKWELYGRETFTMEGDPAIPVIVDTWRKGLRDYDIDGAYAAMKRSAIAAPTAIAWPCPRGPEVFSTPCAASASGWPGVMLPH